jgi:hypothetical protein
LKISPESLIPEPIQYIFLILELPFFLALAFRAIAIISTTASQGNLYRSNHSYCAFSSAVLNAATLATSKRKYVRVLKNA